MNRPCSEKSYIDDDGEAGELDEAWFAKASRGRPKLPSELRKQRISTLLDPDVITHFKSEGRGWQTRINATLTKVAGLWIFCCTRNYDFAIRKVTSPVTCGVERAWVGPKTRLALAINVWRSA